MKKLVVLLSVVTIIMGLVFTVPAFAGKPGGDPVPTGMAIVAKVDGDYEDPVSAMNNLATWCGTPSDVNPCLMKIRPGVYDIGTNSLIMQPYVDIEGSGEGVTKITGTLDGFTGTVEGASNAELRNLTVENTGISIRTYAIYNNNASLKMTHITAIASTNGTLKIAIVNEYSSPIMTNVTAKAYPGGSTGVHNFNSSVTMTNMDIVATGGNPSVGVSNLDSTVTMMNVKVNVRDGVSYIGFSSGGSTITMTNIIANFTSRTPGTGGYGFNTTGYSSISVTNSTIKMSGGDIGLGVRQNASSMTIDNSIISAPTHTIYHINNSSTVDVGSTRLEGGPITGAGVTNCAGVYDENYVFYPNTCP